MSTTMGAASFRFQGGVVMSSWWACSFGAGIGRV